MYSVLNYFEFPNIRTFLLIDLKFNFSKFRTNIPTFPKIRTFLLIDLKFNFSPISSCTYIEYDHSGNEGRNSYDLDSVPELGCDSVVVLSLLFRCSDEFHYITLKEFLREALRVNP